MGERSKIAWTDHTFNPWWGCTRVSEGCVHCYAETLANRTGHHVWGPQAGRRLFDDQHWFEPRVWNRKAHEAARPAFVFCGSMCDWLEDRPDLVQPRERLAQLIQDTPALTWLLLTKRIEKVAALVPERWARHGTPKNVWLGVSAETQLRYDQRIEELMATTYGLGVSRTFVSIEPQLEPITLEGFRPNWVIVGGESGPGCRPFDVAWARSLRDECQDAGIAFFMKQLGGHPSKRDRLEDLPEDLRIRERPEAAMVEAK